MKAPTRRSLLRISGGLFASTVLTGCVGGTGNPGETDSNRTSSKDPTTSDTSVETSSETKVLSTTPEPTSTVDDVATTTTDVADESLETDRVMTEDTATTATNRCADSVQFSELSSAAQKEFKTARDKGGLVKSYDEFHIVDEVKYVDDQIGVKPCIQVDENRYYAVYGCGRNECKLVIIPLGTEFRGFNHGYNKDHDHDSDSESQSNSTCTSTMQE